MSNQPEVPARPSQILMKLNKSGALYRMRNQHTQKISIFGLVVSEILRPQKRGVVFQNAQLHFPPTLEAYNSEMVIAMKVKLGILTYFPLYYTNIASD